MIVKITKKETRSYKMLNLPLSIHLSCITLWIFSAYFPFHFPLSNLSRSRLAFSLDLSRPPPFFLFRSRPSIRRSSRVAFSRALLCSCSFCSRSSRERLLSAISRAMSVAWSRLSLAWSALRRLLGGLAFLKILDNHPFSMPASTDEGNRQCLFCWLLTLFNPSSNTKRKQTAQISFRSIV